MVIDASQRFIDRLAATMLEATKKDGPVKATARIEHLPASTRIEVRKKVLRLKTNR